LSDRNTTPYLMFTDALAHRVAQVPGLVIHQKASRAQQRSVARVYPVGSRFMPAPGYEPTSDRFQHRNDLQWETLNFEICLRYTFVPESFGQWIILNDIIKAVGGYQPYAGVMGDLTQAITAFYITGTGEDKPSDSEGIVETAILVSCDMMRFNGLPPQFRINPQPAFVNPVDVIGRNSWDVVAGFGG
jgi:hypothetical protein